MAIIKHVRKAKDSKKKRTFFEAQVYVRGERVAIKTFDTRAEAEVWHDKTKEELSTGVGAATAKVADVTFEDCLAGYLDEAAPRLRETSRQSLDVRLPYFRESPVRHVRMADFGPGVVDEWISWLLKHPTSQNPGRKSFKIELKYLTVILSWYRNYRDPSFVVPIVKRHRERCQFKATALRRPDYFMRPEDVQAWIYWLRENRTNPVYHRLATLMVLTGARVGEAAGLCWDAIDLDQQIVRVVRTVSWDHLTRQPKLRDCVKTEESARLLPLAPELVDMLSAMRRTAPGTGLVFMGKNGEPLRYNAIQSAFNAGFEALGLPWRSTHICRHTYATMMLLATKDLSAVQANLGHRSRAITERYAKAIAALNNGNATKTAQLIGLQIQNLV